MKFHVHDCSGTSNASDTENIREPQKPIREATRSCLLGVVRQKQSTESVRSTWQGLPHRSWQSGTEERETIHRNLLDRGPWFPRCREWNKGIHLPCYSELILNRPLRLRRLLLLLLLLTDLHNRLSDLWLHDLFPGSFPHCRMHFPPNLRPTRHTSQCVHAHLSFA